MNDELPIFDIPESGLEAARQKIDAMPYEEMLRMVRCSPLSDPLFKGEIGIYFHATFKTKRGLISPEDRAAASERVGI